MASGESGFVYFIEAVGGRRIKIGWTDRHPSRRLATLQTGSCFPLKPLGVMIGLPALEREMHARFRPLRCEGEWFLAKTELRKFISREAQPWPDADERIIRPGAYSVEVHGSPRFADEDFKCDRCGEVIFEGDRWLGCESKQGDRGRVCVACVLIGDNTWHAWVHITNPTSIGYA